MLETSYRPNGWLGIMLGSRLYYEFTEAALAERANWERLADGVAVEVRRHAPSAGAELQAAAPAAPEATPQAKVPGVATVATPAGSAVAAAREAWATSGDAMPRGITVRSNVTNYTNTSKNSSNSNVNSNSNNSTVSVVLM